MTIISDVLVGDIAMSESSWKDTSVRLQPATREHAITLRKLYQQYYSMQLIKTIFVWYEQIKILRTWDDPGLSNPVGHSAQLIVGIFVPSLNPGTDKSRFAFSAHAWL